MVESQQYGHSSSSSFRLTRSGGFDLKEGVGIAEAMTSDQVGVGNKPIPPVGAHATLACPLKEEGNGGCCLMDGVHCQQVQISKT